MSIDSPRMSVLAAAARPWSPEPPKDFLGAIRKRKTNRLFHAIDACYMVEHEYQRPMLHALAASVDCSHSLVRWSRTVHVRNALSAIEPLDFEAVYPLAIQWLCDLPTSTLVDHLASRTLIRPRTFDRDISNVLCLLPKEFHPSGALLAPDPRHASLLKAIHHRSEAEIARAVAEIAGSFERCEIYASQPAPYCWIPLSLLLARALCARHGLAWRDPEVPSWELWIATPARDFAVELAPREKDLLELVELLQPEVKEARERVCDPEESARELEEVKRALVGAFRKMNPAPRKSPRRRR